MLSSLLHIDSCGHFQNIPTHYAKRSNPANYLLIWVLSGRGFGRNTGPRLVGKAGDLFMFAKGVPQEYDALRADPWDILWVHFDGSKAGDFTRRIQHHTGLRSRLGMDVRIHEHFQEMLLTNHSGSAQDRQLSDCLLWGLLGLIVHRLETQAHLSAPANLYDLHRVQAYIQAHLAHPIHLDDLARVAKVSVRQLGRLFQQALHRSPMQYVIQQRMRQGAVLLTETNLPVKQIAAAVGCPDPYYFSRLFRRVMQTTPRRYRLAARTETARTG